MPSGDLSQAVGLVFHSWWLLRGHLPSVASGQGFSNSYYRRFSVTLEDDLVSPPAWVPPGLKLLVHVLDQPAVVTFFAETFMGKRPHILIAS